ncbi:MSEP-CTERM sorting domain-containing protein [Microvirga sp. STR05]|uniref:MSEP-CTERM sorting domain-containing protein n=1 Tax=Hymenobacter duratus TaxID=2771356 RepID=A0ABR8JEU7_9BACT|nr:MSEP-CTERM sorting domain-containing protein [Hymenobacter duratus]MBD2715387.1 MSEP-CTERM sorting domain-containing protein [Hymenobacter duratus]MBR7950294.1 MSEP-CTERM sorting domain-containing protein [Microvirga sp. STR05]
MRNLLHPKWLLLVNTVAIVVLVLLSYGQFNVIQSLLPTRSVQTWAWLGGGLAGMAAGTLTYALWQLRRRQEVSTLYCVLTLAGYAAFICLSVSLADELVPRAVPRWMVPTDPLVYLITFLMPTLAHAGYALVMRLTPTDREYSVLINVLLALAVPGVWFVLIMLPGGFLLENILPAWLSGGLMVTGLVVGTIGFLFYVVRVVYILELRRGGYGREFSLLWKVLLGIVLPVLGLLVNNGLFWGSFGNAETGIFGNFNSPWFYVLAVLNGALLCLPASPNHWRHLLLLFGRSVLLGYTFYFFLVFLPFLPLSLLAVILIGTGFLMLTPLMLLVVHVRELAADWQLLRPLFSGRVLWLVLLGGIGTLPLLITARYLFDRHTLHQALDYRYAPEYGRRYDLNESALARTLAVVKQHKDRSNRGDVMFGSHVPYLSLFFNWLVLDNLTLSDTKIADLEQVFLGALPEETESVARPFATPLPAAPALRNVRTTSTYDARQQAWVSQVELRVANTDTTVRAGEYTTLLSLPAGCWVGDYYLDMNGHREHGVLAEKKAAAWVYAQILSENQVRDPGLLTYQNDHQLSLRVYPVVRRAPRVTGFQLLHKEPVVLTLDGRTLQLGKADGAPAVTAPVLVPGGEVAYVSRAAKQRLPLVQRRPYYHFLFDVSASQQQHQRAYARRLEQQFGTGVLRDTATRFTLVDAYATPMLAGADWAQQLATHQGRGGFYLEGALRQLLVQAHQPPRAAYPIPVVVTGNWAATVLGPDLADLQVAYPESDRFYVLDADRRLTVHSLRQNSRQNLTDTFATLPPLTTQPAVRAWPSATRPLAYLSDNGAAEVVLAHPAAPMRPALVAGGRWQTGLLLHGYQQWQAFHPESTDEQRVPFVRASFRAGILTPFTAYLALENQAQKAALQQKQEQVLSGKAALDVDESEQNQPTAVPLDDYLGLLVLAAVGLATWHLRQLQSA